MLNYYLILFTENPVVCVVAKCIFINSQAASAGAADGN